MPSNKPSSERQILRVFFCTETSVFRKTLSQIGRLRSERVLTGEQRGTERGGRGADNESTLYAFT